MSREQEIIQRAKEAEKGTAFSDIVHKARGVYSAYGIGFIEGAEWSDETRKIRMKWKTIPKDKDGFFDEDSALYEQLPIIIAETYGDGSLYLHYVDEDNWDDTVADLSRQRFKYYINVEPISY